MLQNWAQSGHLTVLVGLKRRQHGPKGRCADIADVDGFWPKVGSQLLCAAAAIVKLPLSAGHQYQLIMVANIGACTGAEFFHFGGLRRYPAMHQRLPAIVYTKLMLQISEAYEQVFGYKLCSKLRYTRPKRPIWKNFQVPKRKTIQMPSNHEITLRLASRLKNERKGKGLSLDALAKLSGVSRSMLSQIERGESSPTVASLWNLTRALNVDFAELLDEKAETSGPILDVVRGESTPVIHNKAARCLIRILSAPADVGDTEVYDIHFESGACLDSSPHKTGCIESLTVLEGRLAVTSAGQCENVAVGDTIRYCADTDHAIHAPEKARALMVVKNA